MEKGTYEKPEAVIIGEDGNIFNLVGIASRALKNAGQEAAAIEMQEAVAACESYASATSLIGEYVVIV